MHIQGRCADLIVKQPRGFLPRHQVAFGCIQPKEDRPCLLAPGQGTASFRFLTSLESRAMARRQSAWPGLLRAVPGLRRTMGVNRHAPRLAARQRGILAL